MPVNIIDKSRPINLKDSGNSKTNIQNIQDSINQVWNYFLDRINKTDNNLVVNRITNPQSIKNDNNGSGETTGLTATITFIEGF
jgi:limonene-1,2-epoxide hydrolase